MRLVISVVCAFVLVALLGCEDDLGEPNNGGTITGTIWIDGEIPAEFAQPGLTIAAVAEFPPSTAPHATLVIEELDFTNGISYELRDLPAYDYFVIAQLRDLEQPLDPLAPFGSFPTYCALTEEVAGNIAVSRGDVVSDVDITLYSGGGFADPCTAAWNDLCPAEGSASLVLKVSAELTPGSADLLSFALFTEWPAVGLPFRFQLIPGTEVELPHTIIDNTLPPGNYAITLCYDVNGDDVFTGGCGAEDLSFLYNDGELVEFQADSLVRMELDLSAMSVVGPIFEDPADFGCASPAARDMDIPNNIVRFPQRQKFGRQLTRQAIGARSSLPQ